MSNVTPYSQPQGWAPVPTRSAGLKALEIVGIALGLVGMVTVVGIVIGQSSANATAIATMIAFLPLLLVIAAIMWVDRWEPEPKLTLLLAFAWGAGVSTWTSLQLNTAIFEGLWAGGMDVYAAELVSAAVGAPIVEEITKGLGVLLIFLFQRRHFDGPLDGFVYAATLAAGFAFVENILYFVQYSDVIGSVFVGRAIMSPFAHIVFTAMIGMLLGVAARSGSWFSWIWLFPLGLVLAILLHGVWNFSTFSASYYLLYLLLQVPMFVTGVGILYWLRHSEKLILLERLNEYALAGWFSPGEVHMLTSLGERRRARNWAKSRGRKNEMKAFQKYATDLAYLREKLATGRVRRTSQQDQQALLNAVTQARASLFA